jgi:hypothetical protein
LQGQAAIPGQIGAALLLHLLPGLLQPLPGFLGVAQALVQGNRCQIIFRSRWKNDLTLRQASLGKEAKM